MAAVAADGASDTGMAEKGVDTANPSTAASINDAEKGVSPPETQQPQEPAPARPIRGVRWFLVCVGIYLTAFLYGLDTTIAADVQGPVLETLGHIELLAWIGIGFPLGSVAVILLYGSLFSNFDFKYLYLIALVLFEVGSAVCGAAPTINALIVGRVIAGVGGAGIYLGGLNYVAVFTTLEERGLYVALIGLHWGIGCILGPVIGGAFSDSSATWRWAFYINLVLAAVTAPIYIILFPKFSFDATTPALTKLRRVDWVGFLLNAAIFALFIVALTFAGSQWRWDSPGTIVLLVLEVVALAAFFLQQGFCLFTGPERRLFPMQFFRSRSILLIALATAITSTGLFYVIYYVPVLFQFTVGDSAIKAAVRLLPFICIFVFVNLLVGGLLPVFGWYAPAFLLTSIFMIVGAALLSQTTAGTSPSAIYGYEVLIAIGTGIGAQMGYTIVASKVSPTEVSSAIGLVNVAQIGSAAVSLAVSGAIFQNVGVTNLAHALAAYDFPRAELENALAGVQSSILSAQGPQVKQLAIGAIVKTISEGYGLVYGAGALLFFAALAMKWERLDLKPTAG